MLQCIRHCLPAIIVFISCWVCITNNGKKKKQASHTSQDNTQLSVKSHFTWVDFKARNIYWTLHSEYFKYMHCTCVINLSGRQMIETIKANVSDMICFKVRVVQAISHPTYYMQIILMRYLPLNLVLSADLFLLYLPSHWPLV